MSLQSQVYLILLMKVAQKKRYKIFLLEAFPRIFEGVPSFFVLKWLFCEAVRRGSTIFSEGENTPSVKKLCISPKPANKISHLIAGRDCNQRDGPRGLKRVSAFFCTHEPEGDKLFLQGWENFF